MIKLRVDEAAAFDMMAIARIKAMSMEDIDDAAVAKEQLIGLQEDIILSIGMGKFNEVLLSKEYSTLYKINEAIFDWRETSDNSDTDMLAARYKCKKDLQKRWFKDELMEIKTNL